LVTLTTLTFGWRKCQKNSHQNNSSISLSLSRTQFQNQLFANLSWRMSSNLTKKNWPKKVSRLRTRVGSPDTVYRSVINRRFHRSAALNLRGLCYTVFFTVSFKFLFHMYVYICGTAFQMSNSFVRGCEIFSTLVTEDL
jgi:hypothetical protein